MAAMDTLASTARRVVTISVLVFAALFMAALTAALLPLLLVIEVRRGARFALVRAALMLNAYLLCEVAGVVAAGWIWLTRGSDRERYLARNFALQRWWARTLFRAGVFFFSLKVDVEGDETSSPGPIILFTRHVSPIDNLVPAVFVADRHAIVLRWVLNRLLLRDPCLDIVGNRLPNAWVRGETSDSAPEIERVRELAAGMGPADGIAIYPEGGFFTPRRRERVIRRLVEDGDPVLAGRAARFRYVLPPKPGGTLALLDAAPTADAVFCAHTGLDRATGYRAIAGGGAAGVTLRIRFWRVPAAEIPAGEAARIAWLFDEWEKVDAFVAGGDGADAP